MPMLSLRLRIVGAIALVCAVTIAGVASYVGRSTLLVHVAEPSGGVRAFLVNPTTHAVESSSGPIAARDVAIRTDGTIELAIRTPGTSQRHVVMLRGGTPLVDGNGRTVWRLFVLPIDPTGDMLAPVRDSILGSIWRSAWLGLAVAVAVAILLASYIIKPIRELTLASEAMGRGDTGRRVGVRGNDEIGRLAASFNAMAGSIETTERLRRQMITDVAHELRSPLTRIIVQLEAAVDGHLSHGEALTGARDEARRLEGIVNDLRDLSLADAHELSISTHDLSLAACIDEALDRAAPRAAAAHVTLARDVAPGLPAARGDELRLSQILDNLIANAVHYTPAGGHVVVGAIANQGDIACFVQDDGAGIAPDQLPLLFERFYRGDPSRSRATGGSGLGLAIVKSLVEAQGGSVGVESTLGHGSRFTWTLPRAAP